MNFEKVKETMVNTLGCEEEKITMDASISDDLGIDSLDAVELVMALEEEFGIKFDEYFAYEMKKLQAYVKHELAELTADKIIVSPKGKIFVRAVAMQFDRYLRESDRAGGYSKIA